MSCAKWKNDIALYAGEDLAAGRIAPVESHLAACAECRALLEDLRDGRGLLGDWQEEPFEDAMLAQVRRRVLARVSETRRPRPALWKLALAAALVLAVWLGWPRQARKQPRTAARLEVPRSVAPAPAPAVRTAIMQATHRVARRRRPYAPVERAQAQPPGAPLLVQFVTDDPNIVIYWLVDQKPEGD